MRLVLFWFRQDLRLTDNPGLLQAAQEGRVMPVYILDPRLELGAASLWWLHHSLEALQQDLGAPLNLYHGDPRDVLPKLVAQHNVSGVYWNRCYEPWSVERDTQIKDQLLEKGVGCKSFNGSLLWEPWTVSKSDGTPYKVFTPFYRKGCLSAPPPRAPLERPAQLTCFQDPQSLDLTDLGLLPAIRWDRSLAPHWEISERGATKRLQNFLEGELAGYKHGRNIPSQAHVSRLSPYLHFGQISPHTVWHAAQAHNAPDVDCDHFLSELGWREFSYALLYHFPDLPRQNLQRSFDAFPWWSEGKMDVTKDSKRDVKNDLQAWQKGQTGYPIVDAGMRELWQTGYMHNRVRMIVGSFLVKNLLIHWHHGADWFWDCLVDADLANNSASWQWIAGSGADAAPYFRIFNPVTQSENFDPEGTYIRQYVPELSQLPLPYLFEPWKAPQQVLSQAGVTLGSTYPRPIVDLAASREAALAAYAHLKLARQS